MVVREILSTYVRQDLLEYFDLDRLERYPTEHINHAGRLLQNDMMWTVPSIDNPDVRQFMFIIFEQQSRVDQAMVLRISNYVNALWGELYRHRERGSDSSPRRFCPW